MAGGQLRCAGSSLFLKKNYGVGYQLTIEKKNDSTEPIEIIPKGKNDEVTDYDDSKKFDEDSAIIEVTNNSNKASSMGINHLVKSAVPNATLLNDVGTEVRYQLPLGASDKFAAMFGALDKEVDEGQIVSYGVSMTTLGKYLLLCWSTCLGEMSAYTFVRL